MTVRLECRACANIGFQVWWTGGYGTLVCIACGTHSGFEPAREDHDSNAEVHGLQAEPA